MADARVFEDDEYDGDENYGDRDDQAANDADDVD